MVPVGYAGAIRTHLRITDGSASVANAVAAVLRFAILRAWVFRPDPPVPAGLAGEQAADEQFAAGQWAGEQA